MRLKPTTLVFLCLYAFALPAVAQRVSKLPPEGTLDISCQLNSTPYPKGTIYVDGQKVGNCPGVTQRFFVGIHSVRVGVDLGNSRYLVYQNEQVEVRRDSTQNITATLAPSTAEKSPALAFAMGVKRLSSIPPTDDFEVAAFSPDASILAINAETNSVRLYDVASGKALHRLGEPGKYWVSFVTGLSFSADGQMLASNGWLMDKYIGEINIWEVKSGRLQRTIQGVKKVSALALSPDGKLLAAGIEPNTIKLWRISDGKLLGSIQPSGDSDDLIRPLFFSPDGQMLIAGHGGADKIGIYDPATAKHVRTLPGRMVTLARDGRLNTYSFKDQLTVRNTWLSLLGEQTESKPVKYSASDLMNGLIVVNSSQLWNARSEQLMVRLPGNYAVALSADGRRLLMNGDEEGSGYVVWSLPAVPDNVPN